MPVEGTRLAEDSAARMPHVPSSLVRGVARALTLRHLSTCVRVRLERLSCSDAEGGRCDDVLTDAVPPTPTSARAAAVVCNFTRISIPIIIHPARLYSTPCGDALGSPQVWKKYFSVEGDISECLENLIRMRKKKPLINRLSAAARALVTTSVLKGDTVCW
ncbi:hypothetical protein MJT46_013495 [Ovis ammon polii x Ovis aries]|nr:hypothetical protein MJT46_013495 [Ovis ammon polii x Ovis aries]